MVTTVPPFIPWTEFVANANGGGPAPPVTLTADDGVTVLTADDGATPLWAS